jgi:hypothetical protein
MSDRPERPHLRCYEDRLHEQHVQKIEAYVDALRAEYRNDIAWRLIIGCCFWTAACGLVWLWLPK